MNSQGVKPNWTRRLVMLAVAGAVVAALVHAFGPVPVAVDLVSLARGDLRVTVADEGRTRVRDVYMVSAPIAGRVLRIEAHSGDVVKAGRTVVAVMQPLAPAFLDTRSRKAGEAAVKMANSARDLAQAEMARAKAELDFAQSELTRAKALASRAAISTRSYDLARMTVRTRTAALQSAKAALKVRDSELDMARAHLIEPATAPQSQGKAGCCVEVFAPIDGRVLRVLDESERVVAAGTPIMELADPRDLEVVVDLLSSEAVKVAVGASVDLIGWGGGKTLSGIVRRIEPYGFTKVSALGIDEQRVNVIIDFESDTQVAPQLGHGYRVEARIVVWQGNNVLRLPLGALFREGGSWAVFVASDGIAKMVPVTLGKRNDAYAELIDGLETGTPVILHPSDEISEGVEIIERGQ